MALSTTRWQHIKVVHSNLLVSIHAKHCQLHGTLEIQSFACSEADKLQSISCAQCWLWQSKAYKIYTENKSDSLKSCKACIGCGMDGRAIACLVTHPKMAAPCTNTGAHTVLTGPQFVSNLDKTPMYQTLV
jgi:hypothetical protein